jgi:AcrR family transcriptional regulator
MKKIDNQEYEKIVHENAKDLIMKYGVKGWSMDELALLSGVAKKTLYGIIGNKEKLMMDLFEKEMNQNHTKMKAIINGSGDSIDKLRELLLDMPSKLGGFTRKFSREMKTEFPLTEKTLKEKYECQVKDVQKFIVQCQNENIIRKEINTDVLMFLMKKLIESFIISDFDEEKFAYYTRTSMEYLMHGIVK